MSGIVKNPSLHSVRFVKLLSLKCRIGNDTSSSIENNVVPVCQRLDSARTFYEVEGETHGAPFGYFAIALEAENSPVFSLLLDEVEHGAPFGHFMRLKVKNTERPLAISLQPLK